MPPSHLPPLLGACKTLTPGTTTYAAVLTIVAPTPRASQRGSASTSGLI